ncbi:MAG: NAD(P)/FAD-dependent oxidoreductase [Desulfobacterales bacterium]|nr:NAD(P)/FAD-dependent oxidoreductase [Desulfobacterales bacterium]
MKKYFAIIVGAGPGGLACARILAEQGREVLVLERNQTIGPKACGGGITWSGLIRRVPEGLIERSFASQHIRTPWQRAVISAPAPIISTVNRQRLGQWMCGRAEAAGARVLSSARVCEISDRHVATADQCFGYQYLVGADGSSSLVRRYLGLASRRVGFGLHYQVRGDFSNMEWHLDTRLFANGYAWIFPHNGSASVGVYSGGSRPGPAMMRKNLHLWAGRQGIKLKGSSPRAGRINFDYQGWRFDNRFLVGDAAGLASGLTGEGMYPAIVSGETAARVILDPRAPCPELEQLVARHRRHTRALALTGGNNWCCSATMELLTLGLRLGLIPFRALEMAN